jgi:hypothetical protein
MPSTPALAYLARRPWSLARRANDSLIAVCRACPARENIQKWRLSQLNRKGLLQCAVKYPVARCIDEVSQQDNVLWSVQLRSLNRSTMAPPQPPEDYQHQPDAPLVAS